MGHLVQKLVVEDAGKASPILAQHVALVAPDGSPVEFGGQAGPAAVEKAGVVKKAAATAAVAAPDAQASAGGAPTKAEFDKAVAVANEAKKQLNALIASLKAAGIAE